MKLFSTLFVLLTLSAQGKEQDTPCPQPTEAIAGLFTLVNSGHPDPVAIQNYLEDQLIAVDALNSQCETPMEVALKHRANEAFHALFSYYQNPDINKMSGKMRKSIYQAALSYGDWATISFLQHKGADLNKTPGSWSYFQKEINLVAAFNKIDVLQKMIANGASVTAPETICLASGYNSPDIVEALVKAGANVNSIWDINWHFKKVPALFFAISRNDGLATMVQTLIRLGANVNKTTNGRTALVFAAAVHSDPLIPKMLLQAGAKASIDVVDSKRPYNFNALTAAAIYTHPEVVQLLLQWGAKPDVRNSRGETALQSMFEIGNNIVGCFDPNHLDASLKIMRLLVAAGASVDAKDTRIDDPFALKMTPLITAADSLLHPYWDLRSGSNELRLVVLPIEVFQTLLGLGASRTAKDSMGRTAYDAATSAQDRNYGDLDIPKPIPNIDAIRALLKPVDDDDSE